MGLQTAVQATGKIRSYTLLIYTPKLLFVPVIWIMLSLNYSILSIMTLFILIELCVALIRIPYCKYRVHLSIPNYAKEVLLPQIPLWLAISAIGISCTYWLNVPFRFILNYIISATVGIIISWFFILEKTEKNYVIQLFSKNKKHD
jgi:hypothetical protein